MVSCVVKFRVQSENDLNSVLVWEKLPIKEDTFLAVLDNISKYSLCKNFKPAIFFFTLYTTTCHNHTLDGSGLAIVRHSLSNDK